MTRQLFGIEGLACAGCARGLEGRLRSLPGVRAAGVHYLTASALIDWDEARTGPDDLAAATRQAGYRMAPRHRPEEISAAMGHEINRLGSLARWRPLRSRCGRCCRGAPKSGSTPPPC